MFVETKREGEISLEPWRNALLKAAEIIEKKGHCIGCLGNEIVGYCMIGALAVAVNGKMIGYIGPIGQRAFNRLVVAVGTMNIGRWNDTHTKAEAIAMLRMAAK